MPEASEVLNSASLLLTVVTVLFALWYPEMKDASMVTVPLHLEDAAHQRETVWEALAARVLPLLLGTALIALTFLPIVVAELAKSWHNVRREGLAAMTDYDPATIALTGVVALALFLAWVLFHLARQLLSLKRRLAE